MEFLSPRFFKGRRNFLHNAMKQILNLEDDDDEHTLALMKAGKELSCLANEKKGKQDKEEEACDLAIPRYLFIDVTCEKGDSVALTGIFENEFPMMFY